MRAYELLSTPELVGCPVALAEALDATLLTLDQRLARVGELECSVEVIGSTVA